VRRGSSEGGRGPGTTPEKRKRERGWETVHRGGKRRTKARKEKDLRVVNKLEVW